MCIHCLFTSCYQTEKSILHAREAVVDQDRTVKWPIHNAKSLTAVSGFEDMSINGNTAVFDDVFIHIPRIMHPAPKRRIQRGQKHMGIK